MFRTAMTSIFATLSTTVIGLTMIVDLATGVSSTASSAGILATSGTIILTSLSEITSATLSSDTGILIVAGSVSFTHDTFLS